MTPVPKIQCVIIIFPVVSRGCSGVQREEVCDAAPYITVCYCIFPVVSRVYREKRCVTPPPTLQCVIVIFPVVSR